MVKKNKAKREISNRLLYTLITIGILAILGFGVYALTPGVAPNPGHLISDIAPPSGCGSGQFLQWTNASSWTCASGGGGSQWTTSGSNIYYTSGNVGIGVAAPISKLEVNGDISLIKDGTTLLASYANLGEDIYGPNQQYSCSSPNSCTGTNPGSDTCNGESGTFTPYNCTASESRTCNDILGASGNINGQFSLAWRQVTCKRAVIFSE